MTLLELVLKVRENLDQEYQLSGRLENYCDLACEKLSQELITHGYSGQIVRGFVEPNFEVDTSDSYGHDWIELNNLILDPTADQFRLEHLIFS